MNQVLKSMQPDYTVSNDRSCPKFLYKVFVNAATTHSEGDAIRAKHWAADIQGQCCKLVMRVSEWEDLHRDCSEDAPYDFIESEYNELITFLSGVAVSCGELMDRLKSADHDMEIGRMPVPNGAVTTGADE